MDLNQQYLSKGFYQYAQIGNPVSVKDYIFIRKDNKKCLLMRFTNNLEYLVNAMEFTVVQMDSAGNILENTKIQYRDILFVPGGTYAQPAGIVVKESCSDFKVIFSKIESGRYAYTASGGYPIVRYSRDAEKLELGHESGTYISHSEGKIRKFGKPYIVAAVAIIAVAAMIGVGAYGAYKNSGYVIQWSLIEEYLRSFGLLDWLK